MCFHANVEASSSSLVQPSCKDPSHWPREKGAESEGGCDAAAKSFKYPAERLSINEVVKGGDVCGGGEVEVFRGRVFALAGFPSFIY